MSTSEIGSLIVSLRTESAAFRAEMDRSRTSLKTVGAQSEISSRQIAKLAGDGFGAVIPIGFQAENAIERFIGSTLKARGALALLGQAGLVVGGALAVGKIVEAAEHYLRFGETVGQLTKRLEDAAAAEKKFLGERQAAVRATIALQTQLAAARGDDVAVLEGQRRARAEAISTVKIASERQKQETLSEQLHLEGLRKIRKEHDDAVLKDLQDEIKARAEAFEKASATFDPEGRGLTAGFKQIRDLKEGARAFGEGIRDLAKAGVPARDIFNEIARAQERFDKKMAELEERFRDQPPLLEALRQSLGALTFGGLQRDLDAVVRSMGGVSQGSADFVDSLGATAASLSSTHQNVNVVTGDLFALAEAFEVARRNAAAFNAEIGGGQGVDLGLIGGGGFRVTLPQQGTIQ